MIICVIGPTCSGKSTLAENLSVFFDAKIVNFDAFQVYREMNIGTAKPTEEELSSGRYLLYNIRDVNENYDVAQYQKLAREILNKVNDENIIFVGGTGLYLKAALYNYHFESEDPMPDEYLSNKTNLELFNELFSIDPVDAKKIGINNRKRLLRSLFIYNNHGKAKSDLNKNGKNELLYKDVMFLGLDINREDLYDKINKRVDIMFANGLEEEVHNLISKYGTNCRSLQGIGYKEFFGETNLDIIKETIKKNTRNYAKRQMTFFRNQFNDVKWFKSIEEAETYAKSNIK